MSGSGGAATIFEKIMSNAHSAASHLRVRSALNPMLWLCAIIGLPCFVLAAVLHDVQLVSGSLLIIGGCPIAATIIGFFYFMVVAPEKLQSEEYQIRQQTLEIIKQKGSTLELSPSSLEAIANPIYSPVKEIGP
jgi:hypothetical protein